MRVLHHGGVLHDVDESLRTLMRKRCGISNDIEVVFDAPTRDWAARRNTPTVDLFLYDIRENMDRRQATLEELRDDQGRVSERPYPTRWFNLSYLVTAWTQRAEDEHRLLSQILLGLLTDHCLPREVLVGALATSVDRSGREVFLTVGRPLAQERSISDIWSALGGELKPSLDLVLVVPFEPQGSLHVGPPVLESTRLRVDGDRPVATRPRTPVPQMPGRPAPRRRSLIEARTEMGPDGRLPGDETIGGDDKLPGRRFRFNLHDGVRDGAPVGEDGAADRSDDGNGAGDAGRGGDGARKGRR